MGSNPLGDASRMKARPDLRPSEATPIKVLVNTAGVEAVVEPRGRRRRSR